MKISFINFSWEFCKIVVPSFLAWFLATRSSKKSFDNNREEMREQLRIAKENNKEVQNNAFKLQFCIKELERISTLAGACAVNFESFRKSTDRILIHKDAISLIRSEAFSSEYSKTCVELSNSLGIFQTVINVVNPNSQVAAREKCDGLMLNLNKLGALIAELNNCVALLSKKEIKVQQAFPKVKNEIEKVDFETVDGELLDFRKFILEHVDITFRKLR